MYPENTYGYTINLLIDEIANQSDSVIINRASYSEDLTNVREAIKELGKYEAEVRLHRNVSAIIPFEIIRG